MSSLNYMELCRLCLVKDRVQIPIFEGEGDIRQIFLKIAACLPVKVKKDDKLPKKICDDCMYKVEMLYQFWNTTANAEKQLLEWLGEAVEEKKTNNDTHVKQESMEQDPGSELAKSLSRVEAVLAEAREAESDNDNFAGSNKAETDSDDEPLSSLEPTTFVNVGLNGSGTNESNTQGEFLAPGAPSTSKTNSTNAQMAASGRKRRRKCPNIKEKRRKKQENVQENEELDDVPLSERKLNLNVKQGAPKVKKIVKFLSKRVICVKCGEKFKNSEMEGHMQDHETKPGHPCKFCDKIFVSVFAWHRHGFKLHGKELKCETCNRTYNDVDRLIRHLRYGHAEKSFVCTICNNYSTSIATRLRKHVEQTHMKQYIVYCDICSKGFFDKTYLEEHKNLHSGDTPHQCELCGKSFRLKTTLRAHRFKFHLELFPFICDTCKKGFATKSGLEAHLNLHAENRQYICDFCGKHLTTVATLTEHRRMHTGEYPFGCDKCSKAFRAKKHLTRHLATHTGNQSERNHECHYCNKKFATVSSCLLHTQKCHGKQTNTLL